VREAASSIAHPPSVRPCGRAPRGAVGMGGASERRRAGGRQTRAVNAVGSSEHAGRLTPGNSTTVGMDGLRRRGREERPAFVSGRDGRLVRREPGTGESRCIRRRCEHARGILSAVVGGSVVRPASRNVIWRQFLRTQASTVPAAVSRWSRQPASAPAGHSEHGVAAGRRADLLLEEVRVPADAAVFNPAHVNPDQGPGPQPLVAPYTITKSPSAATLPVW
jgi:hypothetical protein